MNKPLTKKLLETNKLVLISLSLMEFLLILFLRHPVNRLKKPSSEDLKTRFGRMKTFLGFEMLWAAPGSF